MQEIGVIGGSGVYQMEGVEIVNEHQIHTPYGDPSDVIVEAAINGQKCFFLPRHGRGHKFLPSEVNYRANIYALKTLGVRTLLSVSAVGSLTDESPPGSFVLVDQFIDWTKGQRKRTFFGNGVIGHVSTAKPVEEALRERVSKHCKELNIQHKDGGAYICIEGPQFSSKAESEIYRGFGAKVIGMTNVPEAYLAKEAGMAYATVAMVTDFDCWKEEHCTVEEIIKVMTNNNKEAQKLLSALLPDLGKNPISFEPENRIGLMTPEEAIPAGMKEAVEVLMR